MQEKFEKEFNIFDLNEDEKNMELLRSIIKTKEHLKLAQNNFEYAENDLIDYYSYNIKADLAKLDYLIKQAKSNGLMLQDNGLGLTMHSKHWIINISRFWEDDLIENIIK